MRRTTAALAILVAAVRARSAPLSAPWLSSPVPLSPDAVSSLDAAVRAVDKEQVERSRTLGDSLTRAGDVARWGFRLAGPVGLVGSFDWYDGSHGHAEQTWALQVAF
jgi:RimJ/RimL family protein N-acetyltransferase